MRIPVCSILVKSYLWIQVLVPETQTGMEPEQTQSAVAVAQPESEAVPETQSIEVTQTTSEMEVSREPSEVREEGAYVDSSAYLEATPSAAVVEESKPDDLVTQVVQPEKPVEPSGIEEEKEDEEEEVKEREEGVEGMETVQHEAEPEKLVEQESVTGEQATLGLADTTQGETVVGGAKEAVEDEGGEAEREERQRWRNVVRLWKRGWRRVKVSGHLCKKLRKLKVGWWTWRGVRREVWRAVRRDQRP